ncbi:MAG: hypothetical protein WC389_18835 [Lutibacter sp.]|jgi:hypothetical protein
MKENFYECTLIERREIHIQLEAESKKDAAKKAMEAAIKWSNETEEQEEIRIWVGPEESDFDEEVEVSMALPGPDIFWDEPKFIIPSKS